MSGVHKINELTGHDIGAEPSLVTRMAECTRLRASARRDGACDPVGLVGPSACINIHALDRTCRVRHKPPLAATVAASRDLPLLRGRGGGGRTSSVGGCIVCGLLGGALGALRRLVRGIMIGTATMVPVTAMAPTPLTGLL